jgi:hypothetical protein
MVHRTLKAAGAGVALATLAVLTPATAHAEPIGWGGTIQPGQVYCFTRYAASGVYQVRAEGDATRGGARFRFLLNRGVLQASQTDTTTRFSAERRTSLGNYPGPGLYEICAANHAGTPTLVNLRILFNAEFV